MGLGKGLGCSGTCAKYILFLINFAVFASGAALLGVGIALLIDSESIDWINDITGGTDMNDSLFSAAVYMIVTIGSLLFLVGFLGCCGACKENTCMLQMYIIFVCILLVLELVAGILAAVYINEIDDNVQTKMLDSVKTKYGHPDQTTTTVAWDAMQVNEQCCGAVNYTDYMGSYYQQNTTNEVPESCCKGATIENDVVNLPPTDFDTCKSETVNGGTEQLIMRGCYSTFKQWVEDNSALLMGIAFGLGCVQLLGVIVACCIKGKIEDSTYSV